MRAEDLTAALDIAVRQFLEDNGMPHQKYELRLKGVNALRIRAELGAAASLLDDLLERAVEEGMKSSLVSLPLPTYMERRRITSKKAARVQLWRDLSALRDIRCEARFIGGRALRDTSVAVALSSGSMGQGAHGDIVFRFNSDLFRAMKALAATEALGVDKEAGACHIAR